MPSTRNLDVVKKLTAELEKASGFVLTEYQGLTHKQLEELRKEIKAKQGNFVVAKNSLLRLAIANKHEVPAEAGNLTGPTAILIVHENNPAPLKQVFEKSKELTALSFKWGFWQKEFLNAEKALYFATLPSLEELRARLVGQLAAPNSRLVYALKSNLQRLVYILKSQATKGGES